MAGLSWSIHTLKKSKWQDGDERVSHAVIFLWRRVPSFGFITALQRSDEDHVFNRVCLSVVLSMGETGARSQSPSLYRGLSGSVQVPSLPSVQDPIPTECSNVFNLDSPTPDMCSNFSLWSTDRRKAGGWHSTEMPACSISFHFNTLPLYRICRWHFSPRNNTLLKSTLKPHIGYQILKYNFTIGVTQKEQRKHPRLQLKHIWVMSEHSHQHFLRVIYYN